MDGGALAQLSRAVAAFAKLGAVPVCQLQVVGEDLLVLHEPITCGALEPVGEPLVELGAIGLGQRVVGRVADQDVPELVHLVGGQPGALRCDELATDEPEEAGREIDRGGRRRQGGDGDLLEDATHHGGPLRRRPLADRQPVETGGEQGADRGRDRGPRSRRLRGCRGIVRHRRTRRGHDPLVHEHPDHLLEEERVAFGRGQDAGAQRGGDRGAPRQRIDEPGRGVLGQSSEGDLDGPSALSPAWARVTDLRAGRTDDEQGGRRRPRSTSCSTSSRSVGSAQWMSSITRTSGARGGQMLQRPPDRPEELLLRRRLGGQPDGARQAGRQQRPVAGAHGRADRASVARPSGCRPRRCRPRRAGSRGWASR